MPITVFGHQCSHPLFRGVVFNDVQGSFQIYSSPTVNTLLSITSNCLQWHPGVSVGFKMLEITDCSLYLFFIKYWKHVRNNPAPTHNVIILSYESPLPISLYPRLRQFPEIKDKMSVRTGTEVSYQHQQVPGSQHSVEFFTDAHNLQKLLFPRKVWKWASLLLFLNYKSRFWLPGTCLCLFKAKPFQ